MKFGKELITGKNLDAEKLRGLIENGCREAVPEFFVLCRSSSRLMLVSSRFLENEAKMTDLTVLGFFEDRTDGFEAICGRLRENADSEILDILAMFEDGTGAG